MCYRFVERRENLIILRFLVCDSSETRRVSLSNSNVRIACEISCSVSVFVVFCIANFDYEKQRQLNRQPRERAHDTQQEKGMREKKNTQWIFSPSIERWMNCKCSTFRHEKRHGIFFFVFLLIRFLFSSIVCSTHSKCFRWFGNAMMCTGKKPLRRKEEMFD